MGYSALSQLKHAATHNLKRGAISNVIKNNI